MVQLTQDFRFVNGRPRSEWEKLQLQSMWRRQAEQKQRLAEDQGDDAQFAAFVEVVMASQAQINAVRQKLDAYDQANVQALMLNQEQLDAVAGHLSTLLERAYVMDDGRRVFRTNDGERIFDEFGEEVSLDEVELALMTPAMPTWEEYEPYLREEQRLKAERAELHDHRARLDATRDRIDAGDLTEAELNELDSDLEASMPPIVQDIIADSRRSSVDPNGLAPQTNKTDVITGRSKPGKDWNNPTPRSNF